MISSTQKREVVKAIVEDFLSGKSEEKLASIVQDEIDTHVIPIVSAIESEVVGIIREEAEKAFRRTATTNDRDWWDD